MMKAMVFESAGSPLQPRDLPVPKPGPGQVLIKVHACGVCRTDLHILDGDLKGPKLPLIPGHEIVGIVAKIGEDVENISTGQRIGVPWMGSTCGSCIFCSKGRENLCEMAAFTGYQIDGGYSEYTLANHRYCFPIPENYSDAGAAPLLCAGLIGYRSFRMAGDSSRIGLYGFGAAAHIILQVARHEGRQVYAFTRPGNTLGQAFALSLGAVWAGGSDSPPPEPLDAAIIFAPVGGLVPIALRAVVKGGTVICAGIHMSEIPSFPYELLWGERIVRSVANLTRQDGAEFLQLAPTVPVQTEVSTFALDDANDALESLRSGRIQGAAVLVMDQA